MAGTGVLLCGSMAIAFLACSKSRNISPSGIHTNTEQTEVLAKDSSGSNAEADEVEAANSMVYISNVLLGECLDWADQIVVATTCDGSKAQQRWTYADQTLKIPLSRCMDSGGVALHIWPCAEDGPISRNQRWSYSSTTGLLQNGGSHACLHLRERGNGSSLLSLLPCNPAETRQKWVLRAHTPHMPQTTTSSSNSSGSSRSSINSATKAVGVLPVARTTVYGTPSTSDATSNVVTSLSKIEPDTKAVPEFPLSMTEKPTASPIELPTTETTQELTTGAGIKHERLPPTTSAVTGLESPTVKCDEKETDDKQPHMRREVSTKEAETEAKRAALRFQHHGGCLRIEENLVYLDHCNRSDVYSSWSLMPTGLLRGWTGLCIDGGKELLVAIECDPTTKWQHWTVSGDPAARIKSANGQCLGSRWTIAAPRARVYLSTCNSDDFRQEWTVEQTQVPVEEPEHAHLRFAALFVGTLMFAIVAWFICAIPFVFINKKKKQQEAMKKPRPEFELNYDILRDPTFLGNESSSHFSQELSQPALGPPQQQPTGFRALGICGFAYRRARGRHEGLDALNGCGRLGASHTLSPADCPLQLVIRGQLRTFDNAEAAFQALKFSRMADAFEGLSGEEALQRARELAGAEDSRYDGRGSMWKAMFEVMAVKFKVGTTAAAALEMTGDDFLLCHSCEEGFDIVWSNNHVGNGMNWLGMQLMLIRSSRTGWTRWAQFIEECFDITTGQPLLDMKDRPWVAWHQTIYRATAAIQADLQDHEETLARHDSNATPLGEPEPHAHHAVAVDVLPFPDDDVAVQQTGKY